LTPLLQCLWLQRQHYPQQLLLVLLLLLLLLPPTLSLPCLCLGKQLAAASWPLQQQQQQQAGQCWKAQSLLLVSSRHRA
jgi:hypothetical protein